MIRTRIRTLLVATSAAALLAGCGTMHAGSAAVVGDRRISVEDLQSATKDAQAFVDAQAQAQNAQRQVVSQSQVLYLLAALPYIQELATKDGVGASESDAKAALAQWNVRNPSRAGILVVQANEGLSNIQQLSDQKAAEADASITKSLLADHVEISPRYGTFDPKVGRILQARPNWLPTPSPSAAAGSGAAASPAP